MPIRGRVGFPPGRAIHVLVFITKASNVHLDKKTMDNVPRKHVGIYCASNIYHYSNSHHKVVQQTPQEFSHHYHAPYNAMFYGELP